MNSPINEYERIKIGSSSLYFTLAVQLSVWIFLVFTALAVIGRYSLSRYLGLSILFLVTFIYAIPFFQTILRLRAEAQIFAISKNALILKNGQHKKFESALRFEVLDSVFLTPVIHFADYRFAPSPLLLTKNPHILKIILEWIETSPARDRIVRQIDESLRRQQRNALIFSGGFALIAGLAGAYLSGPILGIFLFVAPLVYPIRRITKPFVSFEQRISI